jgi:uncharacterized protein
MSAELDRLLEPAGLAAKGWCWAGETPLAQWQRLAAVDAAGAEAGHDVTVELSWREDEHGVPLLEAELAWRVSATCQRCLEEMELGLQASPRLFFGTQAQLDASIAGAGFEPCELEPGTTLRQLLEDELLLAMPAFPVHAQAEECGALAKKLAQLEPENDGHSGSSPFAVLAELKRKN